MVGILVSMVEYIAVRFWADKASFTTLLFWNATLSISRCVALGSVCSWLTKLA